MDGLVNYVTRKGAIRKVLMMTNNLMTLDYNYNKHRLKSPPEIFYTLTHPPVSYMYYLKVILGYGPPRERPAPT